ncbi:MAG: GNAT family acetyltransferase [Pseudomonadota bacterium]
MTTDYIIRTANDTDADRLRALWLECGLTRPWNPVGRDIQAALKGDSSTILVLVTDCELTGSVMAGFDGHRGWVYYLAVTPKYQNKSHGKVLMGAAEQWLMDQGVWKVNLMIRPENSKVEAFYHRLGYTTEPRLVMGKQLADPIQD